MSDMNYNMTQNDLDKLIYLDKSPIDKLSPAQIGWAKTLRNSKNMHSIQMELYKVLELWTDLNETQMLFIARALDVAYLEGAASCRWPLLFSEIVYSKEI